MEMKDSKFNHLIQVTFSQRLVNGVEQLKSNQPDVFPTTAILVRAAVIRLLRENDIYV